MENVSVSNIISCLLLADYECICDVESEKAYKLTSEMSQALN